MLDLQTSPSTQLEEDNPQSGCKLMDSFGIFIQLCLAAFAFSTLIFKRQREQPQRPIRIWALDVSKQFAGGIVVHSLNVFAAVFLGVKPEEGKRSNPCVWYFLNIFVDTTLGIGILWLILKGFKSLFNRLQWTGFKSGVYGDPPLKEQLKRWGKQLFVYILSLFLMKIIVVSLFHLCPWIEDFGDWVLEWTVGNYKLQVVFVMLIFPLVMNIMQFWVIDTFIKHKTDDIKDGATIRLTRPEDEDGEILLQPRDEYEDGEEDDRHGNSSSEPNEPPPRYSVHDEENPLQSSSSSFKKQQQQQMSRMQTKH
ncbi:vacuolar membrane protein-domain-containing protein [Mycotypha africana]|uniref:vacuolar membrane protein-domain-containing protein n=1 Tax=Mycotypha africana TaxID=64632 RepID=UPI002301A767|nr:vacuolar membrane protein-domain-containing protein [Mycotypha africana]KAI8968053.1 vacuolar membrane protein-domain-containing protein [Mycotypha africana]